MYIDLRNGLNDREGEPCFPFRQRTLMDWICQAREVCIYHRGLLILLGCSWLTMVSLKDENALGLGWDMSQEKRFMQGIFKGEEL